MADTPPMLTAEFVLKFQDTGITLRRPVHYRYVDPTEGELTRALVVVPPVAVNLPEPAELFPSDNTEENRDCGKSERRRSGGRSASRSAPRVARGAGVAAVPAAGCGQGTGAGIFDYTAARGRTRPATRRRARGRKGNFLRNDRDRFSAYSAANDISGRCRQARARQRRAHCA